MKNDKISSRLANLINPYVWKRRFLHIALRGNNVECPCCGSRYITFLSAGLQKRANAACIKCGSLERHRSLWMYLHQHTNIFSEPLKLLHIAPDKQFYRKFSRSKNIEYYPIDLNPNDYGYGAKTQVMDATDLKYPNDFFDVVICNHVLEHIPNDRKAMCEMFRVLKKNAWAILNVWVNPHFDKTIEEPTITDPEKLMALFGQPDHVRSYGKDYTTRLTETGFKVEVINYALQFTHNEQFRFGLKVDEPIYHCRKEMN